MKKEYEVYHKNMRDAQIYRGNADKPDMIFDTDNWEDFWVDPLLDIVWADDEIEAVKIVAKWKGIHESNLYATQHIASAAASGDPESRLEAFAYTDDDGTIGATISVYSADVPEASIRVSCAGSPADGMECTGKYLLSWNEEYMSMAIIGGPYSDMDTAAAAMRKEVTRRLQELNVAETDGEAADLYETAETASRGEDEIPELHVSECGASIRYGGGHEERYEITEHKMRFTFQQN